ncbi:MAG: colanic acid biosynthesis glycosyltransferase WcaI, partial [Bacteroidota bacterium]
TWLPLQPTKEFLDLLLAADCHLMPQHESAADLVLPSKLGAILATGTPLVVTAHADTELAIFLGTNATLF